MLSGHPVSPAEINGWSLVAAARSMHQTAPPGTKEGNRGRSELVQAAGPGQRGEVLYPGAGSMVETNVASLLHGL